MPSMEQIIAETQAEFKAPAPAGQQSPTQQAGGFNLVDNTTPPPASDMAALIAETQQEMVERPKARQDALSLTENFVVGLNKLQPEKQAEFLREQGFDAFIEKGQVRVARGQGAEDFDLEGAAMGGGARWGGRVASYCREW